MNKEDFEILRERGKFTVSMRLKLIQQEKEERQTLISFVFTLTSILAVIAGFGFTAYQFIKNQSLFFIGEFLVIVSLFYLGFKIKFLLVEWAKTTSRNIYDLEAESAEIKSAMQKGSEKEIKEMGKEFIDKISDTTTGPRIIPAEMIDTILTRSFWISLIGILFILSSFIIYLPMKHLREKYYNLEFESGLNFK